MRKTMWILVAALTVVFAGCDGCSEKQQTAVKDSVACVGDLAKATTPCLDKCLGAGKAKTKECCDTCVGAFLSAPDAAAATCLKTFDANLIKKPEIISAITALLPLVGYTCNFVPPPPPPPPPAVITDVLVPPLDNQP